MINGFLPDKDVHDDVLYIKPIVQKYMPFMDYVLQHDKIMKAVKESELKIDYSLNCLNKILDYKIKVANKNKKGILKDPREKALIDLSDVFSKYKYRKMSKDKTKYHVDVSKEEITILYQYKGEINLPFDKCFIFGYAPIIGSQVVDIEHDNGTYKGMYYIFSPVIGTIQIRFTIERDSVESAWNIKFQFIPKQKPLGGNVTNITSLITSLAVMANMKDKLKQAYEGEPLEAAQLVDIGCGMLIIFDYLSHYKTKYLYKLSKEKQTAYFYTDRINEDAINYIKEAYKGYTYEKLDGWLVNGYYKFTNPKEYGKDKNGKLIKGLDWYIPYEHIQGEEVKEQEQTTNFIKNHAIERAKERYNLDLSLEELQYIQDEIIKGKGTKLAIRDRFGRIYLGKKEKKGCYRYNHKNTILDLVLSKEGGNYRIATFLPKPNDINYNIIDSKTYNEVMSFDKEEE